MTARTSSATRQSTCMPLRAITAPCTTASFTSLTSEARFRTTHGPGGFIPGRAGKFTTAGRRRVRVAAGQLRDGQRPDDRAPARRAAQVEVPVQPGFQAGLAKGRVVLARGDADPVRERHD